MKFVYGRVEIIVGKEGNAGYHNFSLFPQCFLKAPLMESLKVMIVWKTVNSLPNDKFLGWSKSKAFADNK